jgi:hypothetical protein
MKPTNKVVLELCKQIAHPRHGLDLDLPDALAHTPNLPQPPKRCNLTPPAPVTRPAGQQTPLGT